MDIILQSMVELTHIVQRILDELPPRENETGKIRFKAEKSKLLDNKLAIVGGIFFVQPE